MSKIGDSIRRGLGEAVDFAKGQADPKDFRIHVPEKVNVRTIRTRLGLTQEGFAGRFGFSVNAVRHWEQGTRQPETGTRAYLVVIEHDPEAVQAAFHHQYAKA